MNFYKHHLGDYAQATAHLSFVEDAAYSRLLRKYYAEEQPIPADLKAAQRLVGARTREEKAAVETVLEEFFELQADGWHNKRADEEIARANVQAESNRRVAAEREARKRERIAGSGGTNRAQPANESFNESSGSREPSQTPDTRHQTRATSAALTDPEAGARLPPGVSAEAWAAFEAHHSHTRRWSPARRMLAMGQLRGIQREGMDPTAVLTWATTRGLADLADAARRMAADAAKETRDGTRRQPGESLAALSERINGQLEDRERRILEADDAR